MITQIYAGILALMLVGLSIHVIKGRRLHGAGIGDANDVGLKRRIRAHANLVEYAPFFLILMALAEHGGLSHWLVHGLCLAFLLGRVSHAYSLLYAENYEGEKLRGNPIWRIGGMMLTFTTTGLLALIMLFQGFVG
jgi:uncharacterized protein